MSRFTRFFKEKYPKCSQKSEEEMFKFMYDELTTLLNDNATDEINNNNKSEIQLFERNIVFLVNGLISNSFDDVEEESKEKLLQKMLNGEGVKINKLANKYKSSLNKDIYKLRKEIISFINKNDKINSIIIEEEEEDAFDEDLFYDLISKWKNFISSFFTEFHITKRLINRKPYEDILIKHQSFNYKCLSDLFKYMEEFDFFYQIYKNYQSILNNIKKINNIIKNKNMENGENIAKQIDKFYSGFEDCSFNLSSIFNRLNKKVEKVSMDNEILKKKYETIKVECETLRGEFETLRGECDTLRGECDTLKVDNKKLNDRVTVLENGYKDLKMHLKCPISECLMKSPAITPYGFTYEESEIKDWLKKSNTDSLNRGPLTEDN